VKEIACRGKEVVLMDLMGRTLAVEGAWEKANLVDGCAASCRKNDKNGVAISSDTIFC